MRVLLTGSTGFVGKHIQAATDCIILKDDHGIVDLRDAERVQSSLLVDFDAVIHLAAQSYVPKSFENPLATFDVNFNGTYNLLVALKKAEFTGKLIYVSSGDVYGLVPENSLPVTEKCLVKPRNPYAVSKVAAEALCYQWSQTEKFDVIIARPFNHIGPGQGPQFVVSDFARQIQLIKKTGTEPVISVGDIDVTRDFLDVRDVVTAYMSLLRNGKNGETYNICSGKEKSVREIVEELSKLTEVNITLNCDEKRFRPAEQRRIYGSYSKINLETGWEPQIELSNSLKDILTYWGDQIYG